jgi:probable rRNA maturation factor
MSGEPGPKRTGRAAGPTVLVSDRQELPVDASALADLAAVVLAGEGRDDVELSLSFVTPGEIEDLHVRYMDEPGPTDVLSFPLDEDGLIGDVVVCPAVAAANNPGDPAGELRLLVAHGVLHLLGHDHDTAGDRAEMWERQARYSGVQVS